MSEKIAVVDLNKPVDASMIQLLSMLWEENPSMFILSGYTIGDGQLRISFPAGLDSKVIEGQIQQTIGTYVEHVEFS